MFLIWRIVLIRSITLKYGKQAWPTKENIFTHRIEINQDMCDFVMSFKRIAFNCQNDKTPSKLYYGQNERIASKFYYGQNERIASKVVLQKRGSLSKTITISRCTSAKTRCSRPSCTTDERLKTRIVTKSYYKSTVGGSASQFTLSTSKSKGKISDRLKIRSGI